MIERMLDGVIKGEYSLGWALLPLFRVRQISYAVAIKCVSVPIVASHPEV